MMRMFQIAAVHTAAVLLTLLGSTVLFLPFQTDLEQTSSPNGGKRESGIVLRRP